MSYYFNCPMTGENILGLKPFCNTHKEYHFAKVDEPSISIPIESMKANYWLWPNAQHMKKRILNNDHKFNNCSE